MSQVQAQPPVCVQPFRPAVHLALPLIAAAGAMLPRLRAPYVLASVVRLLNLLLFQGIGRDFPLPPRGATIIDMTVVLSFVNIGAFMWHARRFAEVCASEQAARPAAVDLDGGSSYVRG